MKIYVIRHGQTDINIENKINSINDDDLNSTGIEQAKRASEYIKNINYDFIICSPLARTKSTANIINIKNKNIIYDSRIIERNAGIFTKKTIKSIDTSDWWNLHPQENYKDAEKVSEVLDRVYNFLNDIKNKYKDNNIIVVTHGGVCKAINCFFYGIPKDGNLEIYKQDNCEIKIFEI